MKSKFRGARARKVSITFRHQQMERLRPGQRAGQGTSFSNTSLEFGLGTQFGGTLRGKPRYKAGAKLVIKNTTDPAAKSSAVGEQKRRLIEAVEDGKSPRGPRLGRKNNCTPRKARAG